MQLIANGKFGVHPRECFKPASVHPNTSCVMSTSTFRLFFQVEVFDPKVCSWSTYFRKLKNKFTLHNLPEDKKVLLLLDSIGLDTYAKLKDLCQPQNPDEKTFSELESILSNYFEPSPNIYAEHYTLYKRMQQDETVSEYAAKLKCLTKHCKFPAMWLQEALITQLIVGIRNEDLRMKLMQETFETFEKSIEFAHVYTTAKDAAASTSGSMATGENSANLYKMLVFPKRSNQKRNDASKNAGAFNDSNNLRCHQCNRKHQPDRCYKDSTCHRCLEVGHIAPACPMASKSKPSQILIKISSRIRKM